MTRPINRANIAAAMPMITVAAATERENEDN
jgi:hypothetical protein